MDFPRFKQILATFADSSSDVQIEKGQLVLQLRDELISATLSQRNGAVIVNENDESMLAEDWIIKRVARVHILADRIITYISEEPSFVVPHGQLLDQLEFAPEEIPVPQVDVVAAAQVALNRQIPGVCSVLYLTSDAGEGKTTIIGELARRQAELYKKKETSWLLVPVSLGGRPFLRFDDVIVAAMVNRLRFQLLYFDAFVALVKLGVLVPALDGFEEMFIEGGTNQEAVSALGNLIGHLQGEGQVLIAARKAYFEYQGFKAQGRLLDTLPDVDVAFARLSIDRWGRSQFEQYCNRRGILGGAAIYGDVSEKLGVDHPLLTRAVLVKRLLDVAATFDDRKRLLDKLRPEAEDFFVSFVETIIEREATEKWIDKTGQPPGPLLTLDEHHELLCRFAEEMWLNKTSVLQTEYCDLVAQLFCEGRKMSRTTSRQVMDRFKQHALIGHGNSGKKGFAFDHEEFQDFFLGEAVGRSVLARSGAELRTVMRIDLLPGRAMEIAGQYIRSHLADLESAVAILVEIGQSEGPASFTRENCGGLAIRLLDGLDHPTLTLAGLTFEIDSLRGRSISDVDFNSCYLQRTSIAKTSLTRCSFVNCEFEGIELSSTAQIIECTFDGSTRCDSLTPAGAEVAVFDPESIRLSLNNAGFQLPVGEAQVPERVVIEHDERLRVAGRAVRVFLRTTGVNESTYLKRLGQQASYFFDSILPILIDAGIIEESKYRGGGQQSRYRLRARLADIEHALEQSGGSFDRFVEILRQSSSMKD